ncbi:MAG: SsrA-binding protein SmpB [Burkholderiales bacterium]|nr:SsrA-binding protein SmpB [Burkholderiales bacterium]
MAKIQNKKARFNYTIEETFEAGLELKGWEVKSIREGRAQITEAHIYSRNGELFLLNGRVVPLSTASTHEKAEPTRTRKLLMHKSEIMKLIGRSERAGYALLPLEIYFSKHGKVKMTVGLGKGKKLYEKRDEIGEREWRRTQERLLKHKAR